jgi:hypothetical protein
VDGPIRGLLGPIKQVGTAVGTLLAFAVGLLATAIGLDRDRAFYPTVTIVIASYSAFCLTFDVTAAAYLAWRLKIDRIRPRRSPDLCPGRDSRI